MDNASALNIYGNLGSVQYAEENFIYQPVAFPDDPLYPQLWGLPKISAPDAWDITTGDPSVVIADTDTGADYNHVDLAANVWINEHYIAMYNTAFAVTPDQEGTAFVVDRAGAWR